MNNKARVLACVAAASLTTACTVEEMQAFTIGASVAAIAVSSSQNNNNRVRDDAPVECDRGFRPGVGFDRRDRPVYFCLPDDEYFSQDDLDAMARDVR